jgi:hypothetical protein
MAWSLGDIGPPVAQRYDPVGESRVVAPDVTPAQVARMCYLAIQLYHYAEGLIQGVAVFHSRVTPCAHLPGGPRQAMRSLDVTQVPVFEAGVDPVKVRAECRQQLSPPAQSAPAQGSGTQPRWRGQPAADGTRDPSESRLEGDRGLRKV